MFKESLRDNVITDVALSYNNLNDVVNWYSIMSEIPDKRAMELLYLKHRLPQARSLRELRAYSLMSKQEILETIITRDDLSTFTRVVDIIDDNVIIALVRSKSTSIINHVFSITDNAKYIMALALKICTPESLSRFSDITCKIQLSSGRAINVYSRKAMEILKDNTELVLRESLENGDIQYAKTISSKMTEDDIDSFRGRYPQYSFNI